MLKNCLTLEVLEGHLLNLMECLINKSSERNDNRGSVSEYVHEIPVRGSLVKITDFLFFAFVFKTYSCDKKYIEREKR